MDRMAGLTQVLFDRFDVVLRLVMTIIGNAPCSDKSKSWKMGAKCNIRFFGILDGV